MLPVVFMKPFVTFVPEIGGVLLPIGRIKMREFCLAKLKFHMAALCNFPGVVRGLRMVGEQGAHLLLRLVVKLIRGEFHAVLVFDRVVRLDAQQDMVHLAILTPDIMAIVCHDQRDARILGQADQRRIEMCIRDSIRMAALDAQSP